MNVLMLSLLSLGAPSEATESRIDQVVVLVDRAEVTRVARTSCEKGSGQALFPLLPASLDERTLRAEASGKARASAIVSRVVPVDLDLDTRRAKVVQDLRQVQDELRVIYEDAATQEERANGALSYVPYYQALLREEIRNPKADASSWKRVTEILSKDQLEAKQKAIAFRAEARKLERKRKFHERQLAAFQAQAAGEARRVEVTVDCGGAGTAEIRLSYVVPGATWAPEYDLRFNAGDGKKTGPGKVELVVGGVIRQATGEDWENATIILSSAKPKLGGEAPYPAEIVIGGYKVEKKKVLVQGTEDRRQLEEGVTRRGGGPSAATMDDGGRAFALTLPHRTTILSDGNPYWVPVDERSAKGTAKLVTIPKLSGHVYQVLSLTNPAPYPLMEGRLHTHRAGTFVGDSDLPYTAPGEPIEVSLGIDAEIAVERLDLKELEKKPGFLSGTRHLERAYRVRLVNRAKEAVAVELRESIPVSKDEAIEVELVKDKTTKGHTLDALRGFVTWNVQLKRGEERKLDLAYTIHLPEEWVVQ